MLARTIHRILLALSILACPLAPAVAMTLEVVGHQLFATGPVVDDDIARFEDALRNPAVNTLVLVNSPGGDLWNGMRIARLVVARDLTTVAAGSCISSCSLIFMGGKERLFSDAFRPGQTLIGFHGPHDRNTKRVLPDHAVQMYAFYKQRMGDRFQHEVVNRMLYEMDDAGALLRVYDMGRPPARAPFHCRSATIARSACTPMPNADALSLGVITSAQLVPVVLPASMRSAVTLWGQPLPEPSTDLAAAQQALQASACAEDACRRLVQSFFDQPENRALAVPEGGRGAALYANRDTPTQAAMASIFTCNHGPGRPTRLCRLRWVNTSDATPWVGQLEAQHADAVARLVEPTEATYANEEFGGNFTTAGGPRFAKLVDITPASVPGITTVKTRELVGLMRAGKPPLIIDVGGLEPTVPGGLMLAFGGLAFEDAAKERAYHERFAGLLRLLAPDPSQPVVLVGPSRNHWHGLNAALRARQLGYTQVSWYRGGLESWKAAGLPTLPPVVRAVAN
jgi:hypothetical protein